MQKKILILLAFTGIIGFATANAAAIATITALKSPVWLQQNNSKSELGHNSKLKIGDNITTGDAGRIEMKLWVNAVLQLNSNSEIILRAENESDDSSSGPQLELYIHQGRACVNYIALSSKEGKFKVNIGNTMFATIHHHGDICVYRGLGLSSIKLRTGSVQIAHSVGPDLIILSETGTEFHIEDGGSYKLLFPGDDLSTIEIEKPFIVETAVEAVTPAISADAEPGATSEADTTANPSDNANINSDATEEVTPGTAEVNLGSEVPAYIYTVYLFSTRDEEVAEQVNRRIQDAGHDTQILESTTGSILRYRVAVGGFDSKQGARDFSDSIVGKFGITDTWIGRDLRD